MNSAEYMSTVLERENKNYAEISSVVQEEQNIRLIHSALGVSSELLELIQAISGGDRYEILEELGDLWWFTMLGFDALGVRMDSRMISLDPGAVADAARYGLSGLTSELMKNVERYVSDVKAVAIYSRGTAYDEMPGVLGNIWEILVRLPGEISRSLSIPFPYTEHVWEANDRKLAERHGETFSYTGANQRDLVAEKDAMKDDDMDGVDG